MTDRTGPADTATGPMDDFLNGLKAGRLRLQYCDETKKAVFYPRVVSPYSGGGLHWGDVSGYGTVYSVTVTRRKPEKGGDYNICLVDLDEGGRMMSTVVGVPPHQVKIGARVKADIERLGDDDVRVVFRLV